MEYDVIHMGEHTYIRTGGSTKMASEQDAMNLMVACMENDTQLLMLMGENLSDGFFQLRTGLAGAVLQKFANYSITAVAVIPKESSSRGKFGEMVAESNRGRQFRVFENASDAERWLIGKDR